MLRIHRFTHLGRINRVDVFVHWSVPAIAAVMLFGVVERPVTTLVGIACWMGVLLLHECGHMVAAQQRGSHVYKIRLYPIFALTSFRQLSNKPRYEPNEKNHDEIRSRLQIIERTENKPRRTCPLLKVLARTHIATICVIKIAARPKIANPSATDFVAGLIMSKLFPERKQRYS
jgi:hypothetical protein